MVDRSEVCLSHQLSAFPSLLRLSRNKTAKVSQNISSAADFCVCLLSVTLFSRVFLLVCLQVTYRVVQVTDEQLEATADGGGAVSVVSTAAFAGATQAVAQVSKQPVKRQIFGFHHRCHDAKHVWVVKAGKA